jgi:cytoskeletal protein CcmA (bactofilin family)
VVEGLAVTGALVVEGLVLTGALVVEGLVLTGALVAAEELVVAGCTLADAGVGKVGVELVLAAICL